jgi:hypothetical protein
MRRLVFVIAASFLASPAAYPCSFSLIAPDSDPSGFLDGRTDVPTNLVLVLPFGTSQGIFVRRADDAQARREPFAKSGTPGELERLTAPALDPSTEYQMFCGLDLTVATECGRLTTSSGEDVDAPASPLASFTTRGEYAPDLPLGPCGTSIGKDDTAVDVDVTATDGVVTALSLPTGEILDANFLVNGAQTLHGASRDAGHEQWHVQVFDLAGNASAPTIVDVDLGCAGACTQANGGTFAGLAALTLMLRRKRRRSP